VGKFISFEGPEGAGKTTQIQQLRSLLRKMGHTCVVTKEPGGTTIGQKIREILLHSDHSEMVPVCEALLYLADRAQHVQEIIRPNLEEGHWVITDRYHDSTAAYQGAARGLEPETLAGLFQLATGGLKPDLTFLLDIPVDLGLRRANARNMASAQQITEGRFEAETLEFHTRVRNHFLAMARNEPQRFVVVDATMAPERVAEEIAMQLKKRWTLAHV